MSSSPAPSATAFVIDATALLDFHETDAKLVESIARYLGVIHVPSQVLSRARGYRRERWDGDALVISQALVVCEPTLSMLTEATRRSPGLAYIDRLCLLLARQRAATCITHDGCLTTACEQREVVAVSGMTLLAQLVALGHMDPDAGAVLQRRLAACNPFLRDR